jgi:UDP-galactose transporter B1
MGWFLAGGSLFLDAFYVPMVDKLKQEEGGPFMTMFYSYFWSIPLILLWDFHGIIESFKFIGAHPAVILKLLVFGLTGSIAHLSLFVAVAMSDGLVIAIATTTRKFLTIWLSSIIFSHHLTLVQWIGVFTVFFSLSMEIYWKWRERPPEETGITDLIGLNQQYRRGE